MHGLGAQRAFNLPMHGNQAGANLPCNLGLFANGDRVGENIAFHQPLNLHVAFGFQTAIDFEVFAQ